MINRYKTKINEIIRKNLDSCENENTITEYIKSLDLPNRLTKRINDNAEEELIKEFPPQLLEKINIVQQIGGTDGLMKIMNGIGNISNNLIRSLETTLNSFSNEDRDDTMCLRRYGEEKWIRKPSSVMNANYVQAVRQYLDGLYKTRQDIKASS